MKKTKFDHNQIHTFTDNRGRLIALVPLICGRGRVKLLADDLNRLTDADCGPPWYLCGNGQGSFYVVARNPFGRRRTDNTVLARMIAGAARGLRVHYVDKDRLNLLPENLRVGLAGKGQVAKSDFSTGLVEASL